MADIQALFKGPMVNGLLQGRKTQTRRVLGADEDFQLSQPYVANYAEGARAVREGSDSDVAGFLGVAGAAVGDRLWVRETWRPLQGFSNWDLKILYDADGTQSHFLDGDYDSDWNWPKAAANGNVSPLFMPRWASRLTLVVTDVRVERLQAISEEDAIDEGILDCEDDGWGICYSGTHWTYPVPVNEMRHWPREAFQDLWDSIQTKRDYGWATNPWVAALTFTVHQTNIDMLATDG